MTATPHVNGAAFDEEEWRARFGDEESGPASLTSHLRLLDAAAIAGELPEVEYLVAELGMVSGGGAPHLIAGYGYSGKTVAVQSLCLSLAAGRAVWGIHPVRPGRVLHLDYEQGERLTRRRYQRLARAADIDLASLGGRLVLADMPRLLLAEEHEDTWRELMTGRDLIVVDSLRAATGGADENESTIRVPLDMLGRISNATKCRALVVHHGRKPNGESSEDKFTIRGSGAIFDACDAVYVFVASKGDPVSVRQVKARSHGEPIDDFALVIEDVEGAGDDPTWGLSIRVHGRELIAQRRRERVEREEATQLDIDKLALERLLTKHPGIGTSEFRSASRLNGARFAAARLALGDRIKSVEERSGRTKRVRHFLSKDGAS